MIASHEDEMNDEYNEKLCTSNEVIQRNEWGNLKRLQKPTIVDWQRLNHRHCATSLFTCIYAQNCQVYRSLYNGNMIITYWKQQVIFLYEFFSQGEKEW